MAGDVVFRNLAADAGKRQITGAVLEALCRDGERGVMIVGVADGIGGGT